MTITKRATVSTIEDILGVEFKLLDHGFIRVVDYMGDDSAIVQAARVSYGSGTKKINEDRGLIRYLMRHHHTTPFEMCEIKFHIKLPIFIARQWIRHRTANVNEYSARYSILDNEFYIPEVSQMAEQSKINNQGRGETLSEEKAHELAQILKNDCITAYSHYQDALNMEPGLARELARIGLPVNFYTQWYWKIDLHNLLHFLALRADHHAQYEIRVYAEKILEIVKAWVPFTYEAFMDFRVNAKNFSKSALDVISIWVNGGNISQEESGLSMREWKELCDFFGK